MSQIEQENDKLAISEQEKRAYTEREHDQGNSRADETYSEGEKDQEERRDDKTIEHEMLSVVEAFFPEGDWRELHLRGSGVNNTTRFIERAGRRYVLRIYETHREISKVMYEHQVLLALAKQDLSFRVPLPLTAANGETVVRTSEGKLAAMFHYMEGRPPQLQDAAQITQFGETTALLSQALSKVNPDQPPVYPPYYEIEQAHPKCDLQTFIKFCHQPSESFAAPDLRQALASIVKVVEPLQRRLELMKQLPHQLIHGDLNASNALADDTGSITAVLDFEFVTVDLRVMEPAVFISDLIRRGQDVSREGRSLQQIEAYLAGYRRYIELTPEEIACIPDLLLLRRLDVVMHFLGRYWEGIDDEQIVIDQIHYLYAMTMWLDLYADRLVRLLRG